MEEINKKAMDDELNKSEDSIENPPKKFIPVPKVKKKSENDNKNNSLNKKKNYG